MTSLTSAAVATATITASLGFTGVAGLVLIGINAGDKATVVKIVDGDTIDVRYEGEEHRVRLLNIDTPEIGGQAKDTECLAPEAKRYLEKRIPVGSSVRLMWDQDHDDPYGRQLRGVFSNGLVNADIVREGLAVPMHIAPNDRYKDDVDEAYAEASSAKRGLFAQGVDCTIAARTERTEKALTSGNRTAAAKEAQSVVAILGDPDSFASRLLTSSENTQIMKRMKSIVNGTATARQRSTPPATSASRTASTTKSSTPTRPPAKQEKKSPTTSSTRSSPDRSAKHSSPHPPSPTTTRAPAPQRTTVPAPSTTYSPRPTPRYTPPPAPKSTSSPTPPPPPSIRPNNAAPCRSYAPGGKTFTYIDCDTGQPL